jgi:SAM-dependent methyltransferase
MAASRGVAGFLRSIVRTRELPSYAEFAGLMSRYQTKDLVNIGRDEFKKTIDSFLALRDASMEGFADAARQRDLSVQFHWGHDHDFGDFALKGRMADRHVHLLAIFRDRLKALPASLQGKRVLDIGCWTGGTSLLFCALGAQVVAIEEVRKYTDCLSYLKRAFNVERLDARNLSLYECTAPEYQDAFDIVFFAGVLYHISDPVLALRITFNALKDGGTCLVETMCTKSARRIVEYWGPDAFLTRGVRSGWNWFVPSPSALAQMMADVGFEDVQVHVRGDRAYAAGTRRSHVDIMRAGLSVRNIR